MPDRCKREKGACGAATTPQQSGAATSNAQRDKDVGVVATLNMSVIESIINDLKNLPTPKLVEVARYVHGLSQADQEARRELLRQTHGVLSDEDGQVLKWCFTVRVVSKRNGHGMLDATGRPQRSLCKRGRSCALELVVIRSHSSPPSFDANQIRLASAEGLATPLNA